MCLSGLARFARKVPGYARMLLEKQRAMANGYEQEVTRNVIGSCGVARSIIAGFHPADPGSNPGTSTYPQT